MPTTAPSWAHCGRDAAAGAPFAGCTGVAITVSGRCLAHSDAIEQSAYLASLSPGADLDLRGNTVDEPLLDRILNAMTDPAIGRPIVGVALFQSATFNAVRFSSVVFNEVAWFTSATFNGVVWFERAVFNWDAMFESATFNGDARFDSAVFNETAEFESATFNKDARFGATTFKGRAHFGSAAFNEGARFGSVAFEAVARFDGAVFDGAAAFGSATFTGDARFDSTTFNASTEFESATFMRNTRFTSAEFKKTSTLGPLVSTGTVDLSRATFGAAVTLEVAAKQVTFQRTQWRQPATVWLRYAKVDLSDGVAEYPVTFAARARPFTRGRGGSVSESALAGMPTDHVRVVSLRGVDAAQLVLTDLDLSRCLFTGMVHLDQLRLEGDCRFARTPPGFHRQGRLFPVRYTRRNTLADEHHWRSSLPRAVTGWQLPPSGANLVQPPALAAVYRALRKSFEDSRNEPGAADFYYGEMEMRRVDPRTAPAERGLLAAYWALSGYGLRATRALGWLLFAVMLTMLIMMLWGLPQHGTPQFSVGTVTGHRITMTTDNPDPLNPTGPVGDRLNSGRFEKSLRVVVNSVIFRSSGQDLTTTGTYTEMASRLTEPVLLGLAVLALRGRIKR